MFYILLLLACLLFFYFIFKVYPSFQVYETPNNHIYIHKLRIILTSKTEYELVRYSNSKNHTAENVLMSISVERWGRLKIAKNTQVIHFSKKDIESLELTTEKIVQDNEKLSTKGNP